MRVAVFPDLWLKTEEHMLTKHILISQRPKEKETQEMRIVPHQYQRKLGESNLRRFYSVCSL